jgi:hypothetical protein
MKTSGINRRPGENTLYVKFNNSKLQKIKLYWSGVRGLPPALPLVEDVSLLILTPLVVWARTTYKRAIFIPKLLYQDKSL